MPWTVIDPGTLATLGGLGDPPNDPEGLFADDNWAWAWQQWAADKFMQDSDVVPYNAGACMAQLLSGTSLSDLHTTYFADGAQNEVALPMGFKIRLRTIAGGGTDNDEDDLREKVQQEVSNTTYRYLGQFHTELRAVQEAAGQAASTRASQDAVANSGITRDHIDTSMIDDANEQLQKQLNEGDSVAFYQSGDIVMLGDNQYALYYDFLQTEDDYCSGTLTMDEKGGGLSPGSISVQGSNDTDSFKAAVRRYSKKKIDFQ